MGPNICQFTMQVKVHMLAFYVTYLMYINSFFYNCTLHIIPPPSPLACHGIYFNCPIIIHPLYFAFWYIHIHFMKASLRFLIDNQLCNEHHYSPHYVSYVNYFHLPYYDYGNTYTNSFIHNISLNEENSLSHLLDKISPEIENETALLEHSNYYKDADFKSVLHNANSKISMLSLNCQRINAKYDKLKLFLDDVNKDHPISAICIQESWGHEEMEMSYFSLPNYSMVFKNRRLSTHGGLILYIHDDFAYKELNNEIVISHESNLFESIFVELWRKSCSYQKYILGNVYRLPLYGIDDLTSFTNEFTTLLNLLKTRSNFIYLCGDYNIDILKMSSNHIYNTFYENVISCSFAPKITLPTRICDTTSTLIDNVYTNVLDKNYTSGILIRPISDHQMYFCIMNENFRKSASQKKFIELEVFNDESIEKFQNEIANLEMHNQLDANINKNRNRRQVAFR